MRFRVVDGYVVDASDDPDNHFHVDIASQFVAVPPGAPAELGIGWRLANGVWIAPPVPVEPAPVPPPPKILGKVEFIMLATQVGGLTSISTAKADPALADFWIVFDMASQVERDHPFTAQGLAAMEALGHLPAGAAAVHAAWPSA